MSKILVTGVTGPLGGSVLEFLAQKTDPSNLIAFARNKSKAETSIPDGVELRIGNYTDYDSLIKAFKGVDKLYFVSGSEIDQRVKQHENIVNAAKEAGVSHVLYTSFQRKSDLESSPIPEVAEAHIKTENWLKESGLTYTIFRHNLYMDIIPMFIGEDVLEKGTIYTPAGDGKTSYALRKDMAEAAANVLASSGHENKIYTLSLNKAYSYQDIADILSEISGKNIKYISPSLEEFFKTLSDAGVPEELIGMSAGFANAAKLGEFAESHDDLEKLLGHKPTDVPDFLKSVYAK